MNLRLILDSVTSQAMNIYSKYFGGVDSVGQIKLQSQINLHLNLAVALL